MLQNEKQRGPAATGSRQADWRNAAQFYWGALIAFIAPTVSPSPPLNKVSVPWPHGDLSAQTGTFWSLIVIHDRKD